VTTSNPGPSRHWWREPLLHFLAIGALLFLVFNWRGGGAAGSNRIVITPGQIDSMVAAFGRTWQRPPTEQELKGLVDDYVREEMATREAMAMDWTATTRSSGVACGRSSSSWRRTPSTQRRPPTRSSGPGSTRTRRSSGSSRRWRSARST